MIKPNSIEITATDDEGFPIGAVTINGAPMGLHHLVSSSRMVQCFSRQRGHQLPITDCDCVLCEKLNADALKLGIGFGDVIWEPRK